jgi:hypothetical protein
MIAPIMGVQPHDRRRFAIGLATIGVSVAHRPATRRAASP